MLAEDLLCCVCVVIGVDLLEAREFLRFIHCNYIMMMMIFLGIIPLNDEQNGTKNKQTNKQISHLFFIYQCVILLYLIKSSTVGQIAWMERYGNYFKFYFEKEAIK